MRVTHVITRLIVGGAQENTITSVLGLGKKPGLVVDLISGPSEGPEGSLAQCFSSRPSLLRIVPSLVRPIHPIKDLAALNQLTAIFIRTRPDVVHTHSGKAGFLGRLAASRAKVPLIIHTIHGPSFGSFQGPLANGVFKAAERFAAKRTDHFVVVADAMKQQYLAEGIGFPDRYTRIFSGFDVSRFQQPQNVAELRSRFGFRANDFVIGKVARLATLKGHDELIAIAPRLIARHPETKFLLIGDGELRSALQARVRSMGLDDRFVFTGLVAPEEIPRHIAMMDVLAHLSRREGLARALPQALSSACPVVAYDCDGAREVCLPEKTGILVPVGDQEKLYSGLLLLALNPELRRRFGEEGRKFVSEKFDSQTMVDDLHSLYLRLLQKGRN
jgi:glycosyltransferase involved in cell wall biosynthesis